MAEEVTYEPRTYWSQRAAQNGAHYVAKGNDLQHYRREYNEFAPCLSRLVPAGGRLLDFGCGSGRFVELLAGIAREYIGADIAPEGIEIAREQYPEKQFWPVKDSVPTDDRHFDSIVLVMVMQHMVTDFDRWGQEFYRVLKPGGSLVVIDRDPWPDASPLAHMLPRGPKTVEKATGCALAELIRANSDYWAGRYIKRIRTGRV